MGAVRLFAGPVTQVIVAHAGWLMQASAKAEVRADSSEAVLFR